MRTPWRELRDSLSQEALDAFNAISLRVPKRAETENRNADPSVNSVDMARRSENATPSCPEPKVKRVKSAKSPDEDSEASRRLLEANSVSIAVWEDGSMQVVLTEADHEQAERAGGTVYSPHDMIYYLELDQNERTLFHEFKRRFGGRVEWRNNE